MATKENRIALKGRLDFVNRRFKEVTVALIDAQGGLPPDARQIISRVGRGFGPPGAVAVALF